MVHHLRDVVFRIDAQGRWVFLNRAWAELTGRPVAGTLGLEWLQSLHPLDRDAAAARLAALIGSGQEDCLHLARLLTQQGSPRWVELHARLVRDARGRPQGLAGTLTDVSERLRTEERLRLAASVYDGSREGIAITDPQGRILDVNAAFEEITGYHRDAVVGRKPSVLSSGRHDKAFYQAMWAELLDKDGWSGEIWNRRADGTLLAELLRISAVRDPQGRLTHYVAIFSDITSLKRQQETLQRLAHYDALTGLPNRVLLSDRLETLIAQAGRRREHVAVCYLDLDGFKEVNDAWGHATGDALLVLAAERLRQTLRSGDTVARLGGDEFVLLLGQAHTEDEVRAVAERVLAVLGAPFELEHGSARVTSSVGIALYPEHGRTPGHLLRNAAQAMLRAKRQGKNHACFVAEHEVDLFGREQQAQRMRQALHAGELALYYQPKIDARTRCPVGAEALLRWQHPERGLLTPGDFLPQLQGTALECEIDWHVLEQGTAQLGRWAREGRELGLSINLSAATLLHPQLAARVTQLVRQHQVPPGRLELEVLETAALSDLAAVVAAMEACAHAGVCFALDDFGTGYSSLHYLRQLPVKSLKIDQGFVRRMLTDEGDMHIVRAVVGLAGAFGVRTVAEGVETRPHAQALAEIGCDLLQGYWIARPMPAAALERWMSGPVEA
ncbi:putative bifunctional diguanylate cyclase/phosphodiesterase [Azohydromonas caseinilytica]|uniref:EAL domain-containing protein n=1 Tax=Azohydromonas caseinilytica TaxID=2728836 RepID=A0A848FBH8_9BURK|nr:bifunctional diguanylate cyclase/phosphodiesterase [Azohydromonas caseinilytica]NML15673.1 EAL domain-containing protein [Azohydromonas caseinilytica]